MKRLFSIFLFCTLTLVLRAQSEYQQSWVDSLGKLLPDNVYDLSCTALPDSISFFMQEELSCEGVHSMSTPMVADIDGDGIPEIVACGANGVPNHWYGKDLHVFNSQTGQLIRTILTNTYYVQGQCITISDVDRDGHAEIFVLDHLGNIAGYRYDGTSYWANGSTVIPYNYLMTVADIMGDSNVQLVCGDYVFNAQNGTLLLHGSMTDSGRGFGAPNGNDSYSNPYYMYALADIDGDSTLEVCAGKNIYKLNITNYAGSSGNSWQLLRQANDDNAIENYDGQTFVLDFDGDGDLDIGVIGTTHSVGSSATIGAAAHTVNPYVWDGQTGEIIAFTGIDNSGATYRNHAPSIPVVADLDDDGRPEIIFNWIQVGLIRLAYDPSQSGNMRELARNLAYGETTGMTVFDFNNDRHNEIVLRGASALYILDALTLDPLYTPVTVYSGTIAEYPVVADVDGDGEAEIVVAVANAAWTGYNLSGRVKVYGSAGEAWSSARKVWNQWAYSSVNINEDLTVPRYRFDIATRFPNGKQPFNKFLCQMPYLDSKGAKFMLLADLCGETTALGTVSDGMNLQLSLMNRGSETIDAPFEIAVYKNIYRGELLLVDTVLQSLSPEDTIIHTIQIGRSMLCTFNESDSLVVALNDKGIGVAQHGETQEECDTTNNFLIVYPLIHHSSQSTTIFACDSLQWINGETYTTDQSSVVYTIVGGNSEGCDSTVTLQLIIHYSNLIDTFITGCDSVLWNGSMWNVSQEAPFNTHNIYGCDSTVILHLTINRSIVSDTFALVCDTLRWHDELYTSSTEEVSQTYTSVAGCDSVVNLHLTVKHSTTFDTTVVACDRFECLDTIFTESVSGYTKSIRNSVDCDSVVTLNLTIKQSSSNIETDTACDSYTWRGITYTNSITNHKDTLSNIVGCDSVTTLNLTIFNTVHNNIDTVVCDMLEWNSWVLERDTLITDTVQKTDLCDSITVLQLVVNHSTSFDSTVIVCDSFMWVDGNIYTTGGTFSWPQDATAYMNAEGCDSTATLNLTVNYSSFTDTSVVACNSFTWIDGITYTAGGTYTWPPTGATVLNSVGCDSVKTLQLTIHHCSMAVVTACDSYTWKEVEYTHSGIYIDGEDTLDLTVGYSFIGDTTVYACDGYSWKGEEYNESGTYLYQSTDAAGCDSSVTLHLTVNTTTMGDTSALACDSIVWYGTKYSVEGDYQYLTTSVLPSHCDSIITLHLNIIRSQTVDIVDSLCEGNTYHFAGEDITMGGLYYEHLTSSFGCDSTVRLALTLLTPPVVTIDHGYDCLSKTHFLRANTTVDYITWSSSDGWPVSWGSPYSQHVTMAVEHPVQVTLSADYNNYVTCPNSASTIVLPIVLPQAMMKITPEFMTNDDRTITAVSISNDAEWLQWYIDGSDAGTRERVVYTADEAADSVTVTLVAHTTLCADTVEQTVYMRRSNIYVPNTFTPDESTNRTFDIFCIGVLEYELDIYTRQGSLVYHTDMNGSPWDGTKKGKPCPQAAYLWILRYRSLVDPKNWHYEKGIVTLLR